MLKKKVRHFELPSREAIDHLLASGQSVRERILTIARRLESLREYGRDQALRVAADIVLSSPPVGESDRCGSSGTVT